MGGWLYMAKAKLRSKNINNEMIKENVGIWKTINIFYDLSRDKNSTLKDLEEKFIDNIPKNELTFIGYVLFKNLVYNIYTRSEADKLTNVLLQLGHVVFIKTLFLYIKENNIIFPKFMSFYNFKKDYKKILLDKYKGLTDDELEILKNKYSHYTLKEMTELLISIS
jgi:hypothetical protein